MFTTQYIIPDALLTSAANTWLAWEADKLENEGQEAVDAWNAARKAQCATHYDVKNYPQLLDDKIEELRT